MEDQQTEETWVIVAAAGESLRMGLPDGESKQFLLLGGDDGSRTGFQPLAQHPGFPATILAYDAESDTWRENGKVPAPRVTVPTAYWRDRVVIPSGELRPGVRSPEVWTFRRGL